MANLDFDLRVVWSILVRNRQVVLVSCVVALALAFLHGITATPIYRAATLLQIETRGANLLGTAESGTEQAAVLNARIDGEVEILRSSATHLAVIQAADLVSDPLFRPRLSWFARFAIVVGWPDMADDLRALAGLRPATPVSGAVLVNRILADLAEVVTIRRRGLSFLIEISAALPDPVRAAEIANIFAETYLRRQVEAKIRVATEASQVLNRQIETARATLSAAESAINIYIEENLSRIDADSTDPAAMRLRGQVEALRSDLNRSRRDASAAALALDAADFNAVIEALGDAALAELNLQRAALERRMGQVGTDTPEAIDLARRLGSLRDELRNASAERLDALRQATIDLEAREAAAREALRATLLGADLSSDLIAGLFELQQSATIARNQLQVLLARSQEFATRSNLQVADARVVSEALPPARAESPRLQRNLLIALIAGLMLGVAIALIKEFHVGGIASLAQLENVTQWRVPGTLRRVPVPASGSTADLVVTAPMSPYSETFRKLRATIDLSLPPREPGSRGRTILVASALMAEGKTTTAIGLARTYAIAGRRALLIDADLRKPAVGGRLGLECPVGISDHLTGAGRGADDTLRVVVEATTGLHVLTTRRLADAPTDDLINSSAFRALLDNVTLAYDVVVLDTPPLLPLVDTRYMVGLADVVVLVVRFSTTTQGEVREAVTVLQEGLKPEARCLAILSHDESHASRGYGYGRKGAYGYTHEA